MNIQVIIIAVLFAAAVFYVCRLIYKNLFTKKCGVDFSAIEAGKPNK
jgi:hypothetical protein